MVRDAPLLAPCRRPILIATKYMLFRGQDTSVAKRYRSVARILAVDGRRRPLAGKRQWEKFLHRSAKDSGARIYRMPTRSTSEPSGELITAAVMSSRENIVARGSITFSTPTGLMEIRNRMSPISVMVHPFQGASQSI